MIVARYYGFTLDVPPDRLGLLMGKFRQIFTELSSRNTIMAGYYSLMFLYLSVFHPVLKVDLRWQAK